MKSDLEGNVLCVASATKIIIVLSGWAVSASCPVWAHVKWFLSRPESELLKQPKPVLFTQLSLENMLPILGALAIMFILYSLNIRFNHQVRSSRLINWAYKHEPFINLFMAIGLGVSLIYCG